MPEIAAINMFLEVTQLLALGLGALDAQHQIVLLELHGHIAVGSRRRRRRGALSALSGKCTQYFESSTSIPPLLLPS